MQKKFKEIIQGPIVVVITPFNENKKSINEKIMRKNIRYMIREGIENEVGALVIGGSVGESYVLSIEQRKEIFRIAIDEAEDMVPVICGTMHTSTDIVIKLSKYAEKQGADGVMVTPPYYYMDPLDEAILNHYKAISDAIDISILIYNNPGVVNNDLSVDLISKLCNFRNIAAIKESSSNRIKFKLLIDQLGNQLTIINGLGELYEPEGYILGTKSFISAFANVVPKWCVEIHNNCLKKDFKKAGEILQRFKPIFKVICEYKNDFNYTQEPKIYKEVASILGIVPGGSLLPVLPVPGKYKQKLKEALINNGFFEYVENRYY